MAMFQLEIAFLFELALLAAGLVLLHQGKQATAPLLRAAGFVLVVGALLTAACTGYYGVRYHVQGEFDSAYPRHHQRMKHRHPTMGGGMMQHKMMRGSPGAETGTSAGEPEHHPGKKMTPPRQ